MNRSLVLELQKLASSPSTDVATLLRKAMLVAGKLGLAEFRSWIDCELNGYTGKTVPDYRKTRGELRLDNPCHGLVPYVIADAEFADIVQQVKIRDPIGRLVHLLHPGNADHMLNYPLPDPVTAELMRAQVRSGMAAPFPVVLLVSAGALASVVDCIRTKVLDWSIQLEADGILGEGMNFTSDEKQKAATNQNIHIQNFQGVLGNVDGQNQITQNLNLTITTGDFDSLAEHLRAADVPETDINDLQTAIAEDPPATSANTIGKHTSEWIGSMVSKAANGAWNASVGAAGSLLAEAILRYYGVV